MADISIDAIPILGKVFTGILGGVMGALAFLKRYQTKSGCKASHAYHDELQKSRQETRDAKYQILENKIDANAKQQQATHKLVEKIADKIFVVRGGQE